eukprot:COSAG02_NODE_659_length_18772_cov_14.955015_15_plen_69_part_00
MIELKVTELILLRFVGHLRAYGSTHQQQEHRNEQETEDLCHTRQNLVHDRADWQLQRNKGMSCQRDQC